MSERTFHAGDLLGCLRREIQMRERVYPRLIEHDKMSPDRANYEIACMTEASRVLSEFYNSGLGRLHPMATAPRDGRYILLFGPSGYVTTPLRSEVGHWDDDRKAWTDHGNNYFTEGGDEPTFWSPIPTQLATPPEQ